MSFYLDHGKPELWIDVMWPKIYVRIRKLSTLALAPLASKKSILKEVREKKKLKWHKN